MSDSPDQSPVCFDHPTLAPDVEVRIGNARYHLHSAVLSLFSPFFAGKLRGAGEGEVNSDKSILIKYHFGLDEEQRYLVPIGPQSGDAVPETDNDSCKMLHEIIFRKLYQQPPSQPRMSVENAVRLVDMIAHYECAPTIFSSILEGIKGLIAMEISKEPVKFVLMAKQAKSRDILCEAMIHLVGQWETLEPLARTHLSWDLLAIAYKLRTQLLDRCLIADREAFSAFHSLVYYPFTGYHDDIFRDVISGRSIKALVRSQFGVGRCTSKGRYDKPNIGTLTMHELNNHKNKDILTHQFDSLNAALQKCESQFATAVAPVLESKLKFSYPRGVDYLTCVEMGPDDNPW
ncbi:hypothetical protein EDC01DRAFT_789749 [Geopyxis carbonaria]|nr:hypothetical protein EDC01DRAFT_789749 [Geopyxis carbonaria]